MDPNQKTKDENKKGKGASQPEKAAPVKTAQERASSDFEPDRNPPSDPFDEASWESFPASDPPARSVPHPKKKSA